MLDNVYGIEYVSEGSDGPPSPKRTRIDDIGLTAEAVIIYAASSSKANDAPSTNIQAMNIDDIREWIHAVQVELETNAENGSWTSVPRRKDVCPMRCRWVFARKSSEFEQLIRYNDRLVAIGFKKKFGVDFFETC